MRTLEGILADHAFFSGWEPRYLRLAVGCASNVVTALARCRPAAHRDPSSKNATLLPNSILLSARVIPRYAPPTVWVPTPPPNCSSLPAPTRTGSVTRPPSPRCAGWPRFRHPRARSPATDCPAAATGRPTARCIVLRWYASPATPKTRDYVARQVAKGRTNKEILRLLKRAIAREIFRLLTRPAPIDDYPDLRPARQAKNLTLATVAHHFGVPLITISRLERGHQHNDTLAKNYRQWLTAS